MAALWPANEGAHESASGAFTLLICGEPSKLALPLADQRRTATAKMRRHVRTVRTCMVRHTLPQGCTFVLYLPVTSPEDKLADNLFCSLAPDNASTNECSPTRHAKGVTSARKESLHHIRSFSRHARSSLTKTHLAIL